MTPRPAVLTIAGSDSGGGAGIQADLKTFHSFGVHGASAITALTAQNSRAVSDVFVVPVGNVVAQIDAVMSDLQPAVVKLGMLGTADVVRAVAARLEHWKPAFIVLDPVIIASSGATLLEDDAIDALRDLLIPLATVITPNWDEAGVLINAWPRGMEDAERIAISFRRLGAQNLLLKGGHLAGDQVTDTLFYGAGMSESVSFTNKRIEAEGHGTGCTLAAAIAAGLALGNTLVDSTRRAVDFVQRGLQQRYAVGASKQVYLAADV